MQHIGNDLERAEELRLGLGRDAEAYILRLLRLSIHALDILASRINTDCFAVYLLSCLLVLRPIYT